MKKRTIYIGLFLIFIIGLISLIGTFAIDSTITEGNSTKADYLFNITLGDRTNREIVIPSYDSKIVDIKISNPNEFNMAYLLYLEGVNSNLSIINISNTESSGVLNSKTNALIKAFIQNNSSSDITTSIKNIVGFEGEKLSLPSNNTAINIGVYYKTIVKSNNNNYGKVKPNIKLSTSGGTVKYTIVPNTGYQYKSTTCNGTVSNDILTISDITSNTTCEVVFEPKEITVNFDLTGGGIETTYTDPQEHTYTVPYTGTYKIELWGAQGGSSLLDGGTRDVSASKNCVADGTGKCQGGYGSYTSGTIDLVSNEKLYFYVGGKGLTGVVSQNVAGGYNGGGIGTWDNNDNESDGSGGGATDVRLVSGDWNNTTSLASRIMVAAGGGGASDVVSGLAGGGLTNTNQTIANYTAKKFTEVNQVSGYKFGVGQDGVIVRKNYPISGAGGGYYGGYALDNNSDYYNFGEGGSSYISGHTGAVAVISEEDINPKSGCTTGTTDNSCSIHYSGKNFSNTVMIDGLGYAWTNVKSELQQMPNPTGGYYANGAGNIGDGVAKITLTNNFSKMMTYNTEYGNLPTPIKSGYIFKGWYTEPNGKGIKITDNTILTNNKNHTLYAYWAPNVEYTSSGSYTYTIPTSGLYKLETWGAQGGSVAYNGTIYTGGYGGYSTGTVALSAGDILYLNVGGAGVGGVASQHYSGGYNGGGSTNGTSATNRYVSSGGGATHIATKQGLLSTLSSSLDSILIVSGGGGGSYRHVADTRYNSYGGAGGGYIGNDAIVGSLSGSEGLGGSQTAGGKFRNATDATSTNYGSFGMGGSPSESWASGGGGGFYGGGGGKSNSTSSGHSGGGGGSGYIGNDLLKNKYMYCYNCMTSDEETTKTYTTTNVSESPISDYAKGGDGAIRITFIGEDAEPPTGTISTSTDRNVINVSIDATDNYGIDHYEYYLSTSSTCPTTGYTTSNSNTHAFVAKETGTYYVCVKVVDGNSNTLSLKSEAINIQRTYYIKVHYNVNGGVITPNTGNYTWTTDSTGLIYRNGTLYEQTIYYGETADLVDYNNTNYINIDPGELHVPEGGEWICLSGCSTADKVYDQNVKYSTNDFCDVSNTNCTVVLGLRLVSDSTPPTCTLSANSSTISATASDDMGISYQGWDSSYSGENSTTKDISVGEFTYYVKDTAGNTNTCSISITKTSKSDPVVVGTATKNVTGSCNCTKGSSVTYPACNSDGSCSCPSGYTNNYNTCSVTYDCPYSWTVSGTSCVTRYDICASGYTKIDNTYCYK